MSDTSPDAAVSQLGQVALTVSDMERAIAFYRDCLGLSFLFQAPKVAFFDCGGIRLMLGQSENGAAKPSGTILYYKVTDIEAACAALKRRGAPQVREPHLIARLPDHELWLAFFHDPDDNIFALMCEKRSQPYGVTNYAAETEGPA